MSIEVTHTSSVHVHLTLCMQMKLLQKIPACVTFGFRHLISILSFKYIRAFKYNHGVCSISSVPLLTFDSYVIIHTYMHVHTFKLCIWCVFEVWGDYFDNT